MSDTILLRVIPPQGQPFERELVEDELVLGRASNAGLSLPDRYLSRHHARIFRQDGALLIEDLGSRNGTLINGRRIEGPSPLRPGDLIKISGSEVEVVGEGVVPVRNSVQRSGTRVYRQVADMPLAGATIIAPAGGGEPELRDYAERLRLLNEVHHALGDSMELTELLELILDRAFQHLRPEEGVIFLRQPDGTMEPGATRLPTGAGQTLLRSESLVREVTEKRVAALVSDARADERFAGAESILSSGVRSLIAAPLLSSDATMGMIVLGSRAHVRAFDEEDLDLLISLASVASMRLRNVRLAEEAAERRTLEKELALARRIQMALLPDSLPDVPGYELYGGTLPSRTVSGDLYQVLNRGEDECLLFVADVSGKGVAASLLTASLEALTAGPIEVGHSPEEICRLVSSRLHSRTPPEKYATAFLASLVPSTGQLQYSNAGHNPALIVRADGSVEHLTATGTPLGLLAVANFSLASNQLSAGDTLMIYTDGVTEAEAPDGEEYGLDRLCELMSRLRPKPPEEQMALLSDELKEFSQDSVFGDDLTVVLVRRTAD